MDILYSTDKEKILLEEIFSIVDLLPEFLVEESKPLIATSYIDGNIIGAFQDEKLIAFITYIHRENNWIEIEWLAVNPSYGRKKIGTELIKMAMRSNTKKQFFLLTGTQDSIIEGTLFNGARLIDNYHFFQKNGFRVVERIEKKWSNVNHAWRWEFNAEQNELFLDKKLRVLAKIIRPLLNNIANQLKLQFGIIGICFNIPKTDPIFFAEKISTISRKEELEKQTHSISRWSEFVQGLIEKTDPYNFQVKQDELKDLIYDPIEDEFGASIREVTIYPFHLTEKSSVLYVITEPSYLHWKDLSILLGGFKDLVNEILHQALFYCSSSQFELLELTNELSKRLPSPDRVYTEIQIPIYQKIKHPLSRLMSLSNYRIDPVDQKRLLSEEERDLLMFVKGTPSIEIEDTFGGTLQIGKNVYKASISYDDVSFPSVIKFTDSQEAMKDLEGYRKLLLLYDKIGNYLPPIADYWTTVDENHILRDDIVRTLPMLSGKSFYSYVSGINLSRIQKRDIEKLKNAILSCLEFTSKLQIQRNSEFSSSVLIREAFFDNSKDAIRRRKKMGGLFDNLKIQREAQYLSFKGHKVLNPYFFFLNYNEYSIRSKHSNTKSNLFQFGHGDLHLGNILFNDEKGAKQPIIILDFDYVGSKSQNYDRATLESSIFLTLTKRPSITTKKEWEDRVLPLIKRYLSPAKFVTENHFGMNLRNFLKLFRFNLSNYPNDYFHSLLVAYLRMTTSYCRGKKLEEIQEIAMTGIAVTGTLIMDIYEPISDNSIVQEYNLFEK